MRSVSDADAAGTTEGLLDAAGLPPAPDLVRLHLAECAEVHREIYASHRDDYDDDLHAKIAVGFAVGPRSAPRSSPGCSRGAPRAPRSAAGTCSSRLSFRASSRPSTPRPMDLTNRMTAYTRPVNWLGWPSAVTTDGAMHTGRDEAGVLGHALAWEAARSGG